jgi:DNA-binding CsgD family transcriptional regulator
MVEHPMFLYDHREPAISSEKKPSLGERHFLDSTSLAFSPPIDFRDVKLHGRKLDVASLFVLGLSLREVANQLGLSPKTCDEYIDRTKEAFGASSFQLNHFRILLKKYFAFMSQPSPDRAICSSLLSDTDQAAAWQRAVANVQFTETELRTIRQIKTYTSAREISLSESYSESLINHTVRDIIWKLNSVGIPTANFAELRVVLLACSEFTLQAPRGVALSPRESQADALFRAGMNNKQVADALGVDPRTVSIWKMAIREKKKRAKQLPEDKSTQKIP